jgi:hypothetical protein
VIEAQRQLRPEGASAEPFTLEWYAENNRRFVSALLDAHPELAVFLPRACGDP